MLELSFKKNYPLTPFDILVLIVVLLAGLINLPQPFDLDQGLFITGSQAINEGKLLYRDFWDWKQPGIYGFYLLAGRLFGFNEVGIHTFELLYQMSFSVVLLLTLKSYYEFPMIASLVPLLTVGTYYSVSTYWHLTQVEGLVGFPLFLCLWFAYQASRRQIFWLFLSGLMGGIVLLFKFMYLPIIISFWLAIFIVILKQQSKPLKSLLFQFCGSVGLGLLLPLVFVVAYFAHFQILGILYKTFLVYPPRINAETLVNPRYILSRLLNGLLWFSHNFGILIALGITGASISLSNKREQLTWLFSLWLGSGIIVIFSQLISLWEYHYMILLVPLGVLAAKGLDSFWGQLKQIKPFSSGRKGPIIAVISLFFVLLSIFGSLIAKSLTLAGAGFALNPEKRLQYQSQIRYRAAFREIAFLSDPHSLPGDIYVFGDPIYYYLSGRRQAIAVNGLYPPTLLHELWNQILEDLTHKRPSYIFIRRTWKNIIKQRSPEIIDLIQKKYQVLKTSQEGTWYILIP